MADPRIGTLKVGGLDLARRRDFSALVTLEVAAGQAIVTRALRLPQTPYREQLEAIAPILAALNALAYDAGGVGDAIGEQLPISAIPVLIVAGESPPILRNGRCRIGKISLIQNLLILAGQGRLVIPPDLPGAGALREELGQFVVTPIRRGVRMAARGLAHDDLVLALAIAAIALKLWSKVMRKRGALTVDDG